MGRRRDGSAPITARVAQTAAELPLRLPAPYEAFSDSPNLIDRERDDLVACEIAIDTLRVSFWLAGKALQIIRDARLFRATHATFEEYVEDRWQMQRSYAYRLIAAWPLAESLSPIGDTSLNEGQVRELMPLVKRYGEDAAETVYRTIAETDGVKMTAAVIKGAVAVLPAGGEFDTEAAVAQIRAYLAGELRPAVAAQASPEQRVREVGDRIRRLVDPKLIRTVGLDARKELAGQLRALVEELESEGD